MKNVVNVPCIVCGSQRSRLLHSLRFPDQAYPGDFDIRTCSGCGLLFNSPRLTDDAITAMYDGGYYVFQEREAEAMSRVAMLASQTVGVASQYCDARDVLEIGCAKGYLLALLRARGWRVQGVELSSAAAAFAQTRFGLEVFNGTIQDWVRSPAFRRVPLVVSTDVIEHVADPLAFLGNAADALQPGGWLVLGTPNADSDHRLALGPRWLGFNPFHIWLFSRGTLSPLLERAGFEVVEAYTYTNGDPPQAGAAQSLRAAARTALRATGLLGGLRRLRDRRRSESDTPLSLAALEATATQALEGYLTSRDALSDRRAACRGDNLVVIARRR